MRIKFLIAGLLGLVTATTAFAQKGELKDARESYAKFDLLNKSGATPLAQTSLSAAKMSIDKAAANTKTSGLAETWALKGSIYAALALRDTSVVRTAPIFKIADEAIKKAEQMDALNENKKMIVNAKTLLAQYQQNKGVKEYKAKKYDLAYHSFDYYRQAFPDDTNAIYFVGLTAAAAGNIPAALENYKKLVTTKFSQNPAIYYEISSIYLTQKDTTAALKAVAEGIEKFPTNADLRKRDVEISLQRGQLKEVVGKLQSAIANDPKNKSLYYYAGLTYSINAESIGDDLRKAKRAKFIADSIAHIKAPKSKTGVVVQPANVDNGAITKIETLQAQKNEAFVKAAEMFKKAIEIDPSYFEANLNMGYVLITPAIDAYNDAQQLPLNKQKEYDDAIAKAGVKFDLAKPYLLKAVELKPTSIEALTNLKQYYSGKQDLTKANEIAKKIATLQAAAAPVTPIDKK